MTGGCVAVAWRQGTHLPPEPPTNHRVTRLYQVSNNRKLSDDVNCRYIVVLKYVITRSETIWYASSIGDIITRHTLVWQGILSLLSIRFFGYGYLGDGATDRREILHDSTYLPYVFSPLLGEVTQDPQIRNCPTPYIWRVLCSANALVSIYLIG